MARVALSYSVTIYGDDGTKVIGYAQSLTGQKQSRRTKVLRQLTNINPGIGMDQVPEPPEFGFTLHKVVVSGINSDLLHQLEGSATSSIQSIYDQRKLFTVRRMRHDINGTPIMETVWENCMVTDYEMGDDTLDKAEVIESVTVTALTCKTTYEPV